ncbi:MAG: hypothetical protein WC943_01160 [Elusimicrobiota bacterium]|jgi:hypothetical protein
MKRILNAMLAGLMAAAPAGAQPSLFQSESFSVELDNKFMVFDEYKKPGMVREYDGRQYDGYDGKVDLRAYGRPFGDAIAWFDFGLAGINSHEEEGYVDAGVGSFVRLKGGYNTITHRIAFLPFVITQDGYYRTNQMMSSTIGLGGTFDEWMSIGESFAFQRKFLDLGLEVRPLDFLTLDFGYKHDFDTGKSFEVANEQSGRGVTSADYQHVNMVRNDYSVGAQAEIGGVAALAYEHVHTDFRDNSIYAELSHSNTWSTSGLDGGVYPRREHWPMVRWDQDDLRFRAHPSKSLAFTGMLSSSRRRAATSGFKALAYTGMAGASYNPSDHFSVTSKFYARGNVIRENMGYLDSANLNPGSIEQIDKSTVRWELSARHQPLSFLHVDGLYKVEYNRRRYVAAERFNTTTSGLYQDGTFITHETAQQNGTAGQDTKHIMRLGAMVVLPYDVEVEASYKRLQANRAVFENMPTWENAVDVAVNVPLPAGFSVTSAMSKSASRNKFSNLMRGHRKLDTWSVGGGWNGSRGSVGMDFSREDERYFSEGWFGLSNKYSDTSANLVTDMMRDPFMRYEAKNDVVTASGRVRLPLGLAVNGSGTYARSRANTPTFLDRFRAPGAGEDAAGQVTDLGPTDIRVQSLRFGMEWTPEKAQYLTTSFAMRFDRYRDKVEGGMNGHFKLYEAGVNAKF